MKTDLFDTSPDNQEDAVNRTSMPIDNALGGAAEAFAAACDQLSGHPVLRGGVVQAAMNEAIWALYNAFPDCRHDLADHLDSMGEIVREEAAKDRADT